MIDRHFPTRWVSRSKLAETVPTIPLIVFAATLVLCACHSPVSRPPTTDDHTRTSGSPFLQDYEDDATGNRVLLVGVPTAEERPRLAVGFVCRDKRPTWVVAAVMHQGSQPSQSIDVQWRFDSGVGRVETFKRTENGIATSQAHDTGERLLTEAIRSDALTLTFDDGNVSRLDLAAIRDDLNEFRRRCSVWRSTANSKLTEQVDEFTDERTFSVTVRAQPAEPIQFTLDLLATDATLMFSCNDQQSSITSGLILQNEILRDPIPDEWGTPQQNLDELSLGTGLVKLRFDSAPAHDLTWLLFNVPHQDTTSRATEASTIATSPESAGVRFSTRPHRQHSGDDGIALLQEALRSDTLIAKVADSPTHRFDLKSAHGDLTAFVLRCSSLKQPVQDNP